MMTYEQRMMDGHDRMRVALIDAADRELPFVVGGLRLTGDEAIGIVAGAALSVAVGCWAAQSQLPIDERNQLMDEINAACVKFFSHYPNTTVNIYNPA